MLKSTSRACAVCGSSEAEILHTQQFDLPAHHMLPDCYDVVTCKNCGFTFADTDADQLAYNEYYTYLSKYEDEEVSSGGSSAWELERYRAVLDRLTPLIHSESKILDIGCANGGLLGYFIREGYSAVTGLDPSPKCVTFMTDRHIKAVQGDLFHNPLLQSSSKYDLIIVSHVLEHLYDVEKAVDFISGYLNDGGLVYVETPNAARYSDYFIVPYYYFDIEHINHFTEASLHNLFGCKGFGCVKSAETEIPVSQGQMYPAVYGVFRKTQQSATIRFKPLFDDSASQSIAKYVNQSDYSSVNEKLLALSRSKEPCVVWGAGQNTLRLLSESLLSQCNVISFIDKDRSKQSKKMNQAVIVSPEWLIETYYQGTIIISSALFSSDILEELKTMGLSNKTIIV